MEAHMEGIIFEKLMCSSLSGTILSTDAACIQYGKYTKESDNLLVSPRRFVASAERAKSLDTYQSH